MREEAVIALLLVLVIASAGAGYFVGNSSRQTVTTTATSVSLSTSTIGTTYMTTRTQSVLQGTSCSTPVDQPPAGTNDTNLFYLSEQTEATICVTYEYNGTGNSTFGYPILGHVVNSTATACGPYVCGGIKGSVSPTLVQYNGLTNITVTYRISTSAELEKGIYWIGIGQCSPILLVYGQNYTRINAGSIGGDLRGCPSGSPIQYWVVGVSNLTVSAVPVYE